MSLKLENNKVMTLYQFVLGEKSITESVSILRGDDLRV